MKRDLEKIPFTARAIPQTILEIIKKKEEVFCLFFFFFFFFLGGGGVVFIIAKWENKKT